MEIFKTFTFDSAHSLPNVPEGHKCRNIHGHTYYLTVYVKGEPNGAEGWIMDFGDLKMIMDPILKEIDHKYINEIEGLENPTCELFCRWLWNRIQPEVPNLSRIELKETPTSGAVMSA